MGTLKGKNRQTPTDTDLDSPHQIERCSASPPPPASLLVQARRLKAPVTQLMARNLGRQQTGESIHFSTSTPSSIATTPSQAFTRSFKVFNIIAPVSKTQHQINHRSGSPYIEAQRPHLGPQNLSTHPSILESATEHHPPTNQSTHQHSVIQNTGIFPNAGHKVCTIIGTREPWLAGISSGSTPHFVPGSRVANQ